MSIREDIDHIINNQDHRIDACPKCGADLTEFLACPEEATTQVCAYLANNLPDMSEEEIQTAKTGHVAVYVRGKPSVYDSDRAIIKAYQDKLKKELEGV